MAEQKLPLWRRMGEVNPRRTLIFYAVGSLIGIAVAGYGLFTAEGTTTQAIPPENVALVNQRHILRSDFQTQTEVEMALPFEQTTQVQRQKVLQEMINEELLVQRGLEVDLAASDPDVRTAMVAGVNLQVDADIIAQHPTDEQLSTYYEANKAKYSSEGVMQIRDVVTPSDTAVANDAGVRAQKAVAALRAGVPLEKVMEEFGFKDSGRVDAGDVFDFAAKIKLGDKVFAAAQNLKDGEVSDPIVDAPDIHIVLMVRRGAPVARNFAEARDAVWQDFKKEAQLRVEAANIKYLRSQATILIAPEYRVEAAE